jgi:hypothetical protein
MYCLVLLVEFCLELFQRTTPLVVRQTTHLIKHIWDLGKIVFLFTTSNTSPHGNMSVPSWFFSWWYKIAQSSLIHNLGSSTPSYIPLLCPLILVGFEAMLTICVDRLKMSRLWQLISKQPQLLLVISVPGSHLYNTLFNLHVLHVSVNPCSSYIQLDLIPYPVFHH